MCALEQDTYIFPGIDTVVVGITHQENDIDLEPREEDSKSVWKRACALVPSLEVGLRCLRATEYNSLIKIVE